MPMQRLIIQLPAKHKTMLDRLKRDGFSHAAYVRRLLEADLEGWTGFIEGYPKQAVRERPALTKWIVEGGHNPRDRRAGQKGR